MMATVKETMIDTAELDEKIRELLAEINKAQQHVRDCKEKINEYNIEKAKIETQGYTEILKSPYLIMSKDNHHLVFHQVPGEEKCSELRVSFKTLLSAKFSPSDIHAKAFDDGGHYTSGFSYWELKYFRPLTKDQYETLVGEAWDFIHEKERRLKSAGAMISKYIN